MNLYLVTNSCNCQVGGKMKFRNSGTSLPVFIVIHKCLQNVLSWHQPFFPRGDAGYSTDSSCLLASNVECGLSFLAVIYFFSIRIASWAVWKQIGSMPFFVSKACTSLSSFWHAELVWVQAYRVCSGFLLYCYLHKKKHCPLLASLTCITKVNSAV